MAEVLQERVVAVIFMLARLNNAATEEATN